ncbi:hypothetical protein LPB86_01635 [Pedobacter sp. MC2016-14]|uniref:cytidylyltransferase domain-containing protein n=1 Tax=Pedobacter sp. MC2016-14 TaxID=2897327 RepID=UPI001E3C3EAD|nr:hypothetical protein [Pedobacter sp. MC2016-14]MCD0486910.1 hypothetical protein [Pedobacter sp. MC2016-14]
MFNEEGNQELTSKPCFMVQARMGSTRLPNKMTLNFFEGRNLFELILSKLKDNFPEIPIVIATSTMPQNDILAAIAVNKGCEVYRGSENDVLERFINAADQLGYNKIIRVCADNPFLDVLEIGRLLAHLSHNPTDDYIGFMVNGTPGIKTHFGFWVEYVTLHALKMVSGKTAEPLFKEHVTNYIYGHPESFKVKFIPANQRLEGRVDIRMTLDTPEDFEILSQLYARLTSTYGAVFGIAQIVDFLDTHVGYKQKMSAQIGQNLK